MNGLVPLQNILIRLELGVRKESQRPGVRVFVYYLTELRGLSVSDLSKS